MSVVTTFLIDMTSTTDSLSPAEQEALKASTFQRLHPRVYLERFLAENIRPDGRACDAWRDVSVNVGALSSRRISSLDLNPSSGSISTANGSSLVRLGNTTIVCGVKAEIAEPELDREREGFLGTSVIPSFFSLFTLICINPPVPNFDLPAMCSPKFKPGPPTEEAQVLSDRLNEALLASVALAPFSLDRSSQLTVRPPAQASSPSNPSASTPANPHGFSTSTRYASITTVTRSTRLYSPWSSLSKTVGPSFPFPCRVHTRSPQPNSQKRRTTKIQVSPPALGL